MALRDDFTRSDTGVSKTGAYIRIGEFTCSVERRKAEIRMDVYWSRQSYLDGARPYATVPLTFVGHQFTTRIEEPCRALVYDLIKETRFPDAVDVLDDGVSSR